MPEEMGRSASGVPASTPAFEKPLALMEREIQRLEASQSEPGRDYSGTIKAIRSELEAALKKTYANLSPWETVLVARHPKRPLLRDYIRMIAKDFCELHGDRLSGDDGALICGFARVAGHKVMLIGHQKGRDTREKIAANFGCAHPEGYRKALQKMKLAAKFKLPVVCLIDPQVEAEQVQLRERHALRSEHDRKDEVPEGSRDSGDEDQKDHDGPVHGEHDVVPVRRDESTFAVLRGQVHGVHPHREEAADEERDRDRG